MDPSSASSNNNNPHLPRENTNSSYNSYYNGLNSFAENADIPSANDDFADQFFAPGLFENSSTNYDHNYSQQQPSYQQTYDQNIPRQSASPAVSQYNSNQIQFSHSPYSQQLFESRPMSQNQQTFDPRYLQQRPSNSPAPTESYQYAPQLGYSNQSYNPQSLTMQQRQSTTPTTSYPPRPQQVPQFIHYSGQTSQMQYGRNPETMQYPGYQEHAHQPTHSFVDPSMLNASQLSGMNGHHSSFHTPQPYSQSPYFAKAPFTLDPRSLQNNQSPQPPQQTVIQPQQGIQGQPNIPTATAASSLKEAKPPKKVKIKARKEDGTVASASESDSDDLQVENEEPPEAIPYVLSVSAPTDERGKALFNAVQAVWSPRNKSVPAEKVRSGIAQFGETVRTLRDSWKVKSESLKKAEIPNSESASEIPRLKADVSHYRQTMEGVITRCLQYAHPAILKRLGENHFTMTALYSFLLDRFQAVDYDSTLVNNILKFASKFETVDDQLLEKTKWEKILPRFAKKATNDSKMFAQTILTNAAAVTAKKKASGSSEDKATGIVVDLSDANQKAVQASKDTVAGIKRTRDGEVIIPPVVKKTVVKAASKPLALQNQERRRAQEAAQAASTANKTDKIPTANGTLQASTAAKSKIAVAAPPKSTVFSSLMSASKKPGTSLAARAAAAKDKPSATPVAQTPSAPQVKKDPAKKESPPRSLGPAPAAKGGSSFLGFLADMDKKEDVKPQKEEEDIPDETQEERQKRLRKEARRKLRVTWKPDSDLVQTRIFTHDPEEETGQTDSMMRDAGDTVKEGEMLKLHKGMDDLEDDEDEEEQEFDDYSMPTEVDFSDVEKDMVDNSTRFGGPMKPESASKAAQDKLEANTVMVVYASQSDRPPSPKEPPDESDDADADFSPCVDFGEPELKTRNREKELLARRYVPPTNYPANGTDLLSKIQALSQTQPQATQQPQPQAAGINPDLQRTLNMLSQPTQPPLVPQPPPPQQAPPNPSGPVDLQRLMATVAQFKQLQYQAPATNPTPTALPNNLSALLAQFQQPSQNMGLGALGNPNPYPLADDQSRKHGRTDSANDFSSDYGRDSGNKKKKSGKSDGLPYNYKTQTCSFWVKGQCTKGDNCTYRHDNE